MGKIAVSLYSNFPSVLSGITQALSIWEIQLRETWGYISFGISRKADYI
jgi:hypothetical protein